MYDIAMLSNIPGLVYLSPTSAEEFVTMLKWTDEQDFPTAIRINGEAPASKRQIQKIKLNKFELVKKGEKVAIIGLGNFLELAEKVATKLKNNDIISLTRFPCFREVNFFYSDMKCCKF
jgi:1-deoxy-D-xylulose-5-phosphate synthase